MSRRRLPSLNALRTFEAAGRALSFTKAAAELHVTPTAVSHQIRSLEEWLGTKLFERSTRSVRLSEAGERYLPSVQAAFDTLEAGTERIVGRSESRVLTVSTTASFTTKWLVPRLGSFQARHPAVDVRITTSLELVDFATSDVDLAVRYGRGSWPGLETQRLFRERVFPVCSPALQGGRPPLREPADLARHTLLHVARAPDEWRMWLTAAGLPTLKPAGDLTLDQYVSTLQAAMDGLGVALGHTHLVAGDLAAGRLTAPFDLELSGDFAYYVVYPRSPPPSDSARAFRDWLLAMRETD